MILNSINMTFWLAMREDSDRYIRNWPWTNDVVVALTFLWPHRTYLLSPLSPCLFLSLPLPPLLLPSAFVCQIIINLLSNAVKFSNRGEIVLGARCKNNNSSSNNSTTASPTSSPTVPTASPRKKLIFTKEARRVEITIFVKDQGIGNAHSMLSCSSFFFLLRPRSPLTLTLYYPPCF